jgi:hypothetical protein
MAVLLAGRPGRHTSEGVAEHVPLFEGELAVFCQGCKTLETLWFINGHLIETRKFNQTDGQVYHDCGSLEPCRLYRFSGRAILY